MSRQLPIPASAAALAEQPLAVDPAPLAPLEAVSRTEMVAHRIRIAILQGELKPGQWLVERDLARQLGISKTPIREALRVLAKSGLVTIAPFRGAAVRVVDAELALSIHQVRLLLEPEALRLAVPHATAETVTAARDALEQAAAAAERDDHAAHFLWNRSFHHGLYVRCGNPILCSFLNQVFDLVTLISAHSWLSIAGQALAPTSRREAEEHAAILAAVEDGDADAAVRLVREHIEGSQREILEILGGARQ